MNSTLMVQLNKENQIVWLGDEFIHFNLKEKPEVILENGLSSLFDVNDKKYLNLFRWINSGKTSEEKFVLRLNSTSQSLFKVISWKTKTNTFLKISEDILDADSFVFKDVFWNVFTTTFPGGLLFLSVEKKIYEISKSMQDYLDLKDENMISYSKESLIGLNFFDVISRISDSKNIRDAIENGIEKSTLLDEIIQCEDKISFRDKFYRIFVSTVISKNSVVGYCIYSFDITNEASQEEEIEKQRAQLFNSSKLASLGEMAGGIAHEINNPLAIILGTVTILARAQKKDKLSAELLDNSLNEISKTVERISKIIVGLRNLTRKSEDVVLSKHSLKNLLGDVLSLCHEKFKNAGVTIRYDNTSSDFDKEIYCDYVQMSQVFLNLLNNSFDAVIELEDKWVEVKVFENDREIEISFIDSGNGIPNEIIEKMFNPFFTSKEIGQGTGIGLSISKSIVENNNGKLIYDNTYPNTCFVVKISKKDV